ncbi:MAG TPA: hypothetical protein DEP99_01455 [Nitrospiraceae bacterium]|nr:hypothetical protein [Nitrospiraceae bacterium]
MNSLSHIVLLKVFIYINRKVPGFSTRADTQKSRYRETRYKYDRRLACPKRLKPMTAKNLKNQR